MLVLETMKILLFLLGINLAFTFENLWGKVDSPDIAVTTNSFLIKRQDAALDIIIPVFITSFVAASNANMLLSAVETSNNYW